MTSKKPINLLRGWPNPSLLPTPAILRAAQSALSDPSISTPGLLYGPDPGFQPLREEIAKWMSRFYGGEPDADRICISGGASQNLACVLQVFTDPLKTRVWMVAPAYFLACRIFEDSGLRLRAVEEGSEGIDLVALEEELKRVEHDEGDTKTLKRTTPWSKIYRHIIYCVPTFSNPSGKTMSLSNRQKLVQIARKYDALIITDDVYDFLQFPTTSTTAASSLTNALLPRLVDIDRSMEPVPSADSFGNAMSNGSFSKIAGPGVRTGWAEATPKFTYGLSQCGSSRSGGAPSQLAATMMFELLKSGEMETHIQEILCPAYKKRYEIMIAEIEELLVPLGVKVGEVSFGDKAVFGGYFIWLNMPDRISAETVTDVAKTQENLIVAPGHIFEVSNDSRVQFERCIRLCFSWEEEADLKEAITRLARVVKDVMDGKSGIPKENGANKSKLKQDLGEFQ
ncbi:hypothetical protein EG329_006533 [Mollisiaceae sp. DMI_Dod_QoI]|nr:hypothetical protein EG329_006533 [Helotiales sp. DMI_Dod_QoI]